MTTYIFNRAGECIGQSHNLRGMLDRARGDGVRCIEVHHLDDGADRRPGAYVRAHYRSGNFAETYFVCASHALEWARERSASSPRKSWFAGCEVREITHAAGSWNYEAAPGVLGPLED